MTEQPHDKKPAVFDWVKKFGFWFGLTIVLILMRGGMSGLYSGTQRYHYIFGLAKAGVGQLADDWFASTTNPWIVFQWIVQFTIEYLGEPFFYLYHVIMVFIYLYSLVGIADHFFHIRRDRRVFFIFLAFYLSSYAYFWPDRFGHHIYAGVATMFMPLDVFIPNSFAALLFLSIYLFFKEKPAASILSILVACYVHPSYLIVGAALVSGYLLVMFLDGKNLKQLALFGGAAFLLVLPLVAYFYSINLDATAEQARQATNLTAGLLLTHHTHVEVWWNKYEFIKLLIVLGALVAARKNRLFYILLVGLTFVAVPTIVLAIRPSNTLGALMLWRPAVVIVPVATTTLIASWVSHAYAENQAEIATRWKWILLSLAVLTLIVLSDGIAFQINEFKRNIGLRNTPVVLFIKEDLAPGDQYIVPPNTLLASIFRTASGAPTLAIWQQHPWGALDALEWYERVQLRDQFYAINDKKRCEMLSGLAETTGVTHIVMAQSDELICSDLVEIYSDDRYLVYTFSNEHP